MFVVFRIGGSWNYIASIFRIKVVTFQRVFWNYIEIYQKLSYKTMIETRKENCRLKNFQESENKFKFWQKAKYATNVMFHQCNRPVESFI